MTNRQWLMKEMQNMSDEEFADFISNGMDIDLAIPCNPHCDYSSECKDCTINWLKSEHKEIPKLSDAERVILENVDKDYKWICRDKAGNLKVFREKPKKDIQLWICYTNCVYTDIEVFDHLFQFIKWEDIEPYNITELLKGESNVG